MPKKFEINRTKIKGGCQSGRKVVTHNSKSDLPLVNLNTKFGEKNTRYTVCSVNIRCFLSENIDRTHCVYVELLSK